MFKWMKEHRTITCFALAAALLIALLVASYGTHRDPPYALTIQAVMAEIQKPFAKLGRVIDRGTRGVFDFRSLVDENQALREQIAALDEKILDLQLTRTELRELRSLSEALNYPGLQESKLKVAAGVVSMDGSSHFNIFTIDAGTRSGVVADAVVVNGQGLIGRVAETGDQFGKVTSITDMNSNVSFRVYQSDEESYLGIASGNGRGGLSGYMLDTDAKVNPGDRLVTSGLGLYPAGLSIGTISSVTENSEALLKVIEIEPAVDFRNLSKVLVVVTGDML